MTKNAWLASWIVWLALVPFAAAAQTQPAPPASAASAAEDADRDAREAAAQAERDKLRRGNDQATPQTLGDAPLPPQGEPPPPPRFERGPLKVRRNEVSLGVDHALSPQWAIGGVLGYSRGKLERSQAEFVGPTDPGTFSDSTVRTRSTSLTGTLTWFAQPDVFVETSVSGMRTRFEAERLVNDAALFSGRNAGRQWGLSLSAGKVWRSGSVTVIPQLGVDYVDARVDALDTTYTFPATGDGPFPGFQVGAQRWRSWFGSVGGQLQWTTGTSFGTVAPYLRATWRQRLAMHADPVVSTAAPAAPVTTDLTQATSRRLGTFAGGVLVQFIGGISVFADLGATRGNADLRETQLSIGIKFER